MGTNKIYVQKVRMFLKCSKPTFPIFLHNLFPTFPIDQIWAHRGNEQSTSYSVLTMLVLFLVPVKWLENILLILFPIMIFYLNIWQGYSQLKRAFHYSGKIRSFCPLSQEIFSVYFLVQTLLPSEVLGKSLSFSVTILSAVESKDNSITDCTFLAVQ